MKTAKTEVRELIGCFECDTGTMRPIVEDYTIELPSLGKVTIPKVPMLECDCCGDTVIDGDGNAYIDEYIDKATNALRPEELHHFLVKYDLTQKEAAQITGYGEKNISRWLSGRARATTSVSNFFRTLIAEPAAFQRLRDKNWSEAVPKSNFVERMPDVAEKEVLSCIDYKKLVELDLTKKTGKQSERRSEVCRLFQCENLVEFGKLAEEACGLIAARKDTGQQSNRISSGTWIKLGEKVARNILVAPYDRDKLEAVVEELREYTRHDPDVVIKPVQEILARAGVALVFVPIMKHSAIRGCTRLLNPTKAIIIHSLKGRTVSQFWLVLFHEIAHLLLHINSPEDVFEEYIDQKSDPREMDADQWARDTLVYSDKLTEFAVRHPKPKMWELEHFAQEIKVHPAIAAEVFNLRANTKPEPISYGFLRKRGLYPSISAAQASKLWQVTADRIIL